MKYRKPILMMTAALFLALSCKEEVTLPVVVPNVVIEGVPDDGFLLDSAAEDTLRFVVTSDEEWSAGIQGNGWFTVEPREGAPGRTDIKIYASETNPTIYAKEGLVTVQSKDFNAKFKVTQSAAAPCFEVDGVPETGVLFESIPDPVSLQLTGNVSWTWEKEGLDWCEIEVSDPGKRPSVLTLRASNNLGDARNGFLILRPSEGLPEVKVPVAQKEVVPFILVDPESLRFQDDGTPEGTNTVTVSANVDWTLSYAESWVHADKTSGSDGTSILITVDSNETDQERTASLSFSSSKGATAVLTVSQAAGMYYADLEHERVVWKTLDAAYLDQHSPDWSTGGINATSHGSGKGIALPEGDAAHSAYFQWEKVGTGASGDYTPKFVTTVEGHFAVKYMFTDDAYVFYVPAKAIAAGKKVFLSVIMNGNQYCPLHYIIEFSLDGENWVAASTGKNYTTTNLHVPATVQLSKNKALSVLAEYTLDQPFAKGILKARIRVADGTYGIDKKTYTTGSASSTLRIYNSGENEGPAIYVQ